MRRILLFTLAGWVAGAAAAPAAQVLKIATLAPQGSIWDETLRRLGSDVQRDTQKRVELRIYPGGVAGDESDIVRKMRIGQFQGAALTVTGLAEIAPEFRLFQLPLLFDSWQELQAVLVALRPQLEMALRDKGFELLHWGHGGWVHLFSRQPIHTIDDLKRYKLFLWAGDDAQVQYWRGNGFQPVALAATDVMIGFQTGMIDVVPTTPIAALTLQWFRQAPNMQAFGLAPLVGGVVVKEDAWTLLSEADRTALQAAAQVAEKKLDEEVPRLDAEAVTEMEKRGLNVTEMSAEQRAEWQRLAQEFVGSAREARIPPAILDAARKAIAAYRQAHPESGP